MPKPPEPSQDNIEEEPPILDEGPILAESATTITILEHALEESGIVQEDPVAPADHQRLAHDSEELLQMPPDADADDVEVIHMPVLVDENMEIIDADHAGAAGESFDHTWAREIFWILG